MTSTKRSIVDTITQTPGRSRKLSAKTAEKEAATTPNQFTTKEEVDQYKLDLARESVAENYTDEEPMQLSTFDKPKKKSRSKNTDFQEDPEVQAKADYLGDLLSKVGMLTGADIPLWNDSISITERMRRAKESVKPWREYNIYIEKESFPWMPESGKVLPFMVLEKHRNFVVLERDAKLGRYCISLGWYDFVRLARKGCD